MLAVRAESEGEKLKKRVSLLELEVKILKQTNETFRQELADQRKITTDLSLVIFGRNKSSSKSSKCESNMGDSTKETRDLSLKDEKVGLDDLWDFNSAMDMDWATLEVLEEALAHSVSGKSDSSTNILPTPTAR